MEKIVLIGKKTRLNLLCLIWVILSH